MSKRTAAALALIAIGVALFMLGTAIKAQAHTEAEQRAWETEWTERAEKRLTPALIDEWIDFQSRHHERPTIARSGPTPASAPPSTRRVSVSPGVEQWRPLVSAYFAPGDVDRALCLMWHESRGNPNAKNPRSTASGLFQILRFWWTDYGIDPFNPDRNVWLAAKIKASQGWGAWAPYNRGLCR